MSKQSQVVLITGCGSGIGLALAREMHQRGHRVCATARRLDSMAALAAEGILTRALDVTSASAVAALMAGLHAEGLKVGMLVNNAGYGAMGPVLDIPDTEWAHQFNVNLFAPMAMVRAVVPDMLALGGGRVVNVSSVSGVMTTPFAGAYCASKAALNAVSDALRMELAPLGISVVTVQPGGIQSGFGQAASDRVNLAPDSLYLPVKAGVMARANESQAEATPVAVFVRDLATQLGRPDCPPIVRLGAKSRLLPWLKRHVPVRLLDRMLSKRFQLNRLPKAGR
ncbi:MAG: hypothetical protein RI907_2339 [Pseudomonadota bacterium]|jgi:NAD(P)-dependent dehydrogenase (short-subunit alcohol dehydrogenase family)